MFSFFVLLFSLFALNFAQNSDIYKDHIDINENDFMDFMDNDYEADVNDLGMVGQHHHLINSIRALNPSGEEDDVIFGEDGGDLGMKEMLLDTLAEAHGGDIETSANALLADIIEETPEGAPGLGRTFRTDATSAPIVSDSDEVPQAEHMQSPHGEDSSSSAMQGTPSLPSSTTSSSSYSSTPSPSSSSSLEGRQDDRIAYGFLDGLKGLLGGTGSEEGPKPTEPPKKKTLFGGLLKDKLVKGMGMDPNGFAGGVVDAILSGDKLNMMQSFAKTMFFNKMPNECTRDMVRLFLDLNRKMNYTYKIADSFGKPPSGIYQGNVLWLGDYDQCLSLDLYPQDAELDHFKGKYCRAKINVPTQMRKSGIPIKYGLCLPDTCQTEDVPAFMAKLLKMAKVKNITVTDAECPVDAEISKAGYATICILSLFALLVIVGTLYDGLRRFLSHDNDGPLHSESCEETEHRFSVNSEVSTVSKATLVFNDELAREHDVIMAERRRTRTASTLYGTEELPHGVQAYKEHQQQTSSCSCACLKSCTSVLHQLMMAFSLFMNTGRLLDTRRGPDHVSVVDGIRVLTSGWLILGNATILMLAYLGNPVALFKEMRTFAFQPIVNSALTIDAFFLLGGFLVAYMTMNKLAKANNGVWGVNWFTHILHRLWRVTPTYMIILLIWSTLFASMLRGPLAGVMNTNPRLTSCSEYWWSNLLYINNFIPDDASTQCMGWSWYLATDMQLFLLSPIFVLALYFAWKAAVPIMAIGITACVIITGLMSRHIQKQSPVSLRDLSVTYFNGPMSTDWGHIMVRPYYRIAPYLIGMLVGFVVHVRRNRPVKMNKILSTFVWIVMLLVCMGSVYGLFGHYKLGASFPVNLSSSYLASSRVAFTICVAWVIFACQTGNGGVITVLLSWKGWRPLGRLSFIVFLIHPVVIHYVYSSQRTPIIFLNINLAYMFVGHVVMSYLLAFGLHLLVEAPLLSLERLCRKAYVARFRPDELKGNPNNHKETA